MPDKDITKYSLGGFIIGNKGAKIQGEYQADRARATGATADQAAKLAAETADTSNAVKALIVHAEDSRILRDMPAAIAAAIRITRNEEVASFVKLPIEVK